MATCIFRAVPSSTRICISALEPDGIRVSSSVLAHTARVGDHNDRGMKGPDIVRAALGRWQVIKPAVLSHPEPAVNGSWGVEWEAATPGLRSLQTAYGAAQYPDAVAVCSDIHADLNIPDNTTTGYLGGLALSASLGWH